jgi:hypothetical protein
MRQCVPLDIPLKVRNYDVVVNHSPFANFTFLGGIGIVGIWASSTKAQLTKLCELPQSNRISITLSFTRVFNFIELSMSMLDKAFWDS